LVDDRTTVGCDRRIADGARDNRRRLTEAITDVDHIACAGRSRPARLNEKGDEPPIRTDRGHKRDSGQDGAIGGDADQLSRSCDAIANDDVAVAVVQRDEPAIGAQGGHPATADELCGSCGPVPHIDRSGGTERDETAIGRDGRLPTLGVEL
jgi:hypothetical protein